MPEFRYAKGRIGDSLQYSLARLAFQRNRLAHRYLNFRWEAIRMFKDKRDIILELISRILEREEKKEEKRDK